MAGRPGFPPCSRMGRLVPMSTQQGLQTVFLPLPFPQGNKTTQKQEWATGNPFLIVVQTRWKISADQMSSLPVRITEEAALRVRPLANSVSLQPQMRHREGKKYLVNLKYKKTRLLLKKMLYKVKQSNSHINGTSSHDKNSWATCSLKVKLVN